MTAIHFRLRIIPIRLPSASIEQKEYSTEFKTHTIPYESDLVDTFHSPQIVPMDTIIPSPHNSNPKDHKSFTFPFCVSDIRCLEPYGLEMSKIIGQKTTFAR